MLARLTEEAKGQQPYPSVSSWPGIGNIDLALDRLLGENAPSSAGTVTRLLGSRRHGKTECSCGNSAVWRRLQLFYIRIRYIYRLAGEGEGSIVEITKWLICLVSYQESPRSGQKASAGYRPCKES